MCSFLFLFLLTSLCDSLSSCSCHLLSLLLRKTGLEPAEPWKGPADAVGRVLGGSRIVRITSDTSALIVWKVETCRWKAQNQNQSPWQLFLQINDDVESHFVWAYLWEQAGRELRCKLSKEMVENCAFWIPEINHGES